LNQQPIAATTLAKWRDWTLKWRHWTLVHGHRVPVR